jgi:UDP-N-acetylmuramate dehydrogenase
MESEALLREIRSRIPGLKLLENEPMARHCSFHIGGPVTAMALPCSAEETAQLCRVLREAGITPLIMGKGTNLLVTDAPLSRFVVRLGEGMSAMERRSETELFAQSGAALSRLASAACAQGLAGLEFAHGIPGSIGGAVSMNAGAYGGEMKDVVRSVLYLDEELELREAHGPALGFSYRRSRFSDTGDVILGALVSLVPGDPAEIGGRMRELADRRRASQPLDLYSAGSTFKRPQNGYAAALIEKAGLKGYTVGGACVSEKHAGFVVNLGGASFDDVRRVMEHVQETVFRLFGVALEPEVKIIEN